jgi:hypothetical protein
MFPPRGACLNGQPGGDQEWPTAAILNVNGTPTNRNRTTPGRADSAAILLEGEDTAKIHLTACHPERPRFASRAEEPVLRVCDFFEFSTTWSS